MKEMPKETREDSANLPRFAYPDIRSAVHSMLPVPVAFGDEDNLIELGLDSLKIMRLVNAWRRAGASVTFAELIEAPLLRNW